MGSSGHMMIGSWHREEMIIRLGLTSLVNLSFILTFVVSIVVVWLLLDNDYERCKLDSEPKSYILANQ